MIFSLKVNRGKVGILLCEEFENDIFEPSKAPFNLEQIGNGSKFWDLIRSVSANCVWYKIMAKINIVCKPHFVRG